jgi:ATP-binding cassette subfamily B protein/subfamily B ATP-binding cassette protein MsbA
MVSAYSPARLAALAAFATLPLAAQAADIRVMCYQDGVECEVTAAIAKRFEAQNPGTKVIIDTVPYKSIVEQLPVQLAAGQGPDIARVTDLGGLSKYYLDVRPHLKNAAYMEANFGSTLPWLRPTAADKGIYGFMSQLTHTTDMLAGGITAVYGGAVTEPLKIFACLAGAFCISWQLTLACLTLAPIVGFLMVWLNRRIRGISKNILSRSKGFHHVLLEALNNVLTVQAYTMEEFERQRFRSCTRDMMKTGMWHSFYFALANPITEILGIGMVATSIAVGAWLVINQETQIFGLTMTERPMTVPGIMVFFGMLIGASDPVRKLSGVFTGVNLGIVGAQQLYPLLDTPSKLSEPAEPKSVASPHREIRLENVSFSYDGIDTVLSGVNLSIPFGERVAIVGPNGGGKSTLVNLVCRFYDPTQGAVLLDGVPLTDMMVHDLRRRIAMVTQQTELFNESILYNIRYGRWDATEEEIIEAATKAHAHEFISEFPDGYQTMVGPNGFRLSGGQRQRISLARAFLRNAEILVLDEATSQIDVESERLIHEALARYVENRTVIMITHRASTLALADAIIKVEHGVVTKRPAAQMQAA